MRKQHSDDRDIIVRAITAAARELGAENPMFPKAVAWFLDNVPAVVGLFDEESQMFWDIQYRQDPDVSREDHIHAVVSRYGYEPGDFVAITRRYDRWQERCEAIFLPESEMGDLLWNCLKHLYPPPRDNSGETETFYV